MDRMIKGVEGLLKGDDAWKENANSHLSTGEIVLQNEGLKKEIGSLFFRSEDLAKQVSTLERRLKMYEAGYDQCDSNKNNNNSNCENNGPNSTKQKDYEFINNNKETHNSETHANKFVIEELEKEIKELKGDKSKLEQKVERMAENLKRLRYKDLMDNSKLNQTNDDLRREILAMEAKEGTGNNQVSQAVSELKRANRDLLIEVKDLKERLKSKDYESSNKK